MVKKPRISDVSKIYRIYYAIDNLQKKQEELSTDEILDELAGMKKLAAKIKDKKRAAELTEAIDKFIKAIEATTKGAIDTAEQYIDEMAEIEREVSGG